MSTPCTACGSEERSPYTGRCKPCDRRRNAARWAKPEYRAENTARQSAWRDANIAHARQRAKLAARATRANPRERPRLKDIALRAVHGITLEELALIVELQRHACAICKGSIGLKPEELRAFLVESRKGQKRQFNVDHDHAYRDATGDKRRSIRGVLCHTCNRAMYAIDTPGWLEAALTYRDAYLRRRGT